MNKEWIQQIKETRRNFNTSTWIPLRASKMDQQGNVQKVGYREEFFGCGSVAFPPEHIDRAENLSWGQIGIGHDVQPYAYDDGYYASIEQYQYNDKEPIGVNLIFDYPQPVIGGKKWMLNPDLVVALGLIKEGQSWVRPKENFVEVIREHFDDQGDHVLIEIKKEFLLDYLAARNLSLKLSYYRQRVENVELIENSNYADLTNYSEKRDNGRFELLIRKLEDVYGGNWASFRVWRTDVDEEEDAPIMGMETDNNTESESSSGYKSGYKGTRIEGEFWRDEWIKHQGKSIRIRGDIDEALPQFIVETDSTRMKSEDLNNEDIGRWLWFRANIINELLGHRGFSLEWYTAETGALHSTSGYRIHFGVNSEDLITVYACDIARLYPWEQHIWAANNVAPNGKVSSELLMSQVKAMPASTHAPETLLLKVAQLLESSFEQKYGAKLFLHNLKEDDYFKNISRFLSRDQASLLRLAKEIIKFFSERLNKEELRKLSTHKNKNGLGSNKLLESILAEKIGEERARDVFSIIVGVYDMRIGDAHPTSSKIGEALELAKIDVDSSYLKQGEQLISNFGQSVWLIGKLLFGENED